MFWYYENDEVGVMKMAKLMFMFCCYGNGNVLVFKKMAKLPSPMLASVTMCNDGISLC